MGNEVAVRDDASVVPAGLEDFEASDMAIPRLNIDHKEAVFVDSQTNEVYEDLTVVALGLVKQRVLFEPVVETGAKPLCKSYNHAEGHADPAAFPWKPSGFARADYDDDEPVLPCEGCALKEFGSHPERQGVPWCTEQFVLPSVMPFDDEGGVAPILLTFQKSQLKPVRAYITAFAKRKQPLFMVYTKIELEANRRGTVDYAVPKLTKLDVTDAIYHNEFTETFRSIRDMLTTPRAAPTADEDKGDDSTPEAAPPQPEPTPEQPKDEPPATAEPQPAQVSEPAAPEKKEDDPDFDPF